MKTIYTKLAELKKEVGKMTKDSKNPFFNSKYFDINQLLEHLEPLIQKNGLIILQPIINKEVVSKIIEIETGDEICSSLELPPLTDPQIRCCKSIFHVCHFALNEKLFTDYML